LRSTECRLPLTQISPQLAAELDRAMDLLGEPLRLQPARHHERRWAAP
jgi:hypothetical protein